MTSAPAFGKIVTWRVPLVWLCMCSMVKHCLNDVVFGGLQFSFTGFSTGK